MQTSNDLKNLLERIDRRSYPAYKETRGAYRFGDYVLSIDHVQGDPFAAPSRVSVRVEGKRAAFPPELYRTSCRRVAIQDALIRRFGRLAAGASGQARGSGHSGLIALSRCGQEVLERTACTLNPDSGDVLLRLEVGFPANGRTINARELEQSAALGYCLRYAHRHLLDGRKTLRQVVEELERILDRDGVEALWEEGGGVPFLARPRAQEMFACFNRYRALELTR